MLDASETSTTLQYTALALGLECKVKKWINKNFQTQNATQYCTVLTPQTWVCALASLQILKVI